MGKIFFIRMKDYIFNHYFSALVIATVAFSFLLRYFHTKIGLPYLYHWDEPQTASTALNIMKTGDFNPHFFRYGSMMIYSNLIVDIFHYFSLIGNSITSESHLTSLNDIIINTDTGWHWTISHPSFYLWNRILTAIMGTATVFVTYLIGKHIFNRWIGLVAALFLATLPYHILHSAIITTDVPVALFVLAVVLFSIYFIKYKEIKHYILSLVFAGMAIATKYNAATSLSVSFIALVWVWLQSRESVKHYMWFLIPTIPFIVFLLIMPYAIIDFTTFLRHVGSEVHHYKVIGHGGSTSTPGWEHFSFQMLAIYKNIGLANTAGIVLGALGVFFRPLLIFTLLAPVLYILFMSGMKVNFHRNYIQIYPFIALLFASGCYYLFHQIEAARKQILPRAEIVSIYIIITIFSLLIIPQAISSFNTGLEKYHTKDNRTIAINDLNALTGMKKIIIAEELRVHSQDLKKLNLPYRIRPILSISSKPADKTAIYVLPSNVTSFNKERDKKKLEPMQRFISKIDNASIVKRLGGERGTRIDIYSKNPGILIVKNFHFVPIETK